MEVLRVVVKDNIDRLVYINRTVSLATWNEWHSALLQVVFSRQDKEERCL